MIHIGIECESIEDDSWGIARIITKLLEDLSQRTDLYDRFRFHLYFKSKIPDYHFLNSPLFVKEVILPSWSPKSFSLYYYIILPIYLWFKNIDVVFFPNYMLPILFFGKSIVMLTHDAYYESISNNITFRYRLAYQIFCTWAARHATKIMAISEFSKTELIKIYEIEPQRITVNHLAVDQLPEFSQDKKNGRSHILFVGQTFPRRHLKETMLAFKTIASDFPELDFRIVGVDKYKPTIVRDLVHTINKELGSERVFYQERVPEAKLLELYDSTTLCTYISSKEAFGLPPLEALAHGAVPIVADNELSRELFGEQAFFVKEPYSVKSIASTLRQALSNQTKREDILRSRQALLAQYTWRAHADRFLKIASDIATS